MVVFTAASAARAQTPSDAGSGRIEIAGGGGLLSGAPFGDTDANLRGNSQNVQPYRLFASESRLDRSPSVHLRAGVPLGRRFGLEGGVTWMRPTISTLTSHDVEGAADMTISEQVDEYFFDGGITVALNALRIGARATPFIAAGGGYLRQLHEGHTIIEHGQVYYAGGGLKYALRSRPAGPMRGIGVRVDARTYVTSGGIVLEKGPRPRGAISGGLYLRF